MDGLEVIVSVNEVGVPFPASIAATIDDVKIGLPGKYANAVISGIAKICRKDWRTQEAEPAVCMGSARSRGFVSSGFRAGEWYSAPTAHAVLRLGRSDPRVIRVRGNRYSSSRLTGPRSRHTAFGRNSEPARRRHRQPDAHGDGRPVMPLT